MSDQINITYFVTAQLVAEITHYSVWRLPQRKLVLLTNAAGPPTEACRVVCQTQTDLNEIMTGKRGPRMGEVEVDRSLDHGPFETLAEARKIARSLAALHSFGYVEDLSEKQTMKTNGIPVRLPTENG